MREPIRDKGRLEHMLQSIDNVARYVAGVKYADFEKDDMRYYAIVKNIEIIGEAAYMLSSEFKESHPEIEWPLMIKMRHVLVHGYYQLEPLEIWNTATVDIPSLRPVITSFIEKMA